MSKPAVRFVFRVLIRSIPLFLVLVFTASSAHAQNQGLAGVALGKTGDNAVAVYHAKVREQVTTLLQKWTESLEHKDSAATVSVYTANARSFMGKLPEAATADAVVTQLYKTTLPGAQLALTVDDFEMSGELAFVTSVLVVKADAPDAAPSYIRSLFVFRFDDWRNRWQVREQFLDWRPTSEAGQPAQ
jgi:ketosteroid isomerase-like protein